MDEQSFSCATMSKGGSGTRDMYRIRVRRGPGEVFGDASGETLGDGSRTVWASRNAVFLQCIVASAESCRRARKDAGGDLPGP